LIWRGGKGRTTKGAPAPWVAPCVPHATSHAVCCPCQESRRASPAPRVAPCVAHGMSCAVSPTPRVASCVAPRVHRVSPAPCVAPCIIARATSCILRRPWNELHHVAHTTSWVVCRLRHVSRHESRCVSPMPGVAPCIAHARSCVVCRLRHVSRRVTHATSRAVCRARHELCHVAHVNRAHGGIRINGKPPYLKREHAPSTSTSISLSSLRSASHPSSSTLA